MSSKMEVRNIEFFECDCYDKGDLIRAEYSEWIWKNKDGTSHRDRDLDITFTTKLADYHQTSFDGFIGWFKRMWWRIRKSSLILFTGEVTTEGYFMPCRSLVDSKKEEIEHVFGYQTTKDFANWLNTMADKLKADYEQDIKDYEETVKNKQKTV